MPENNAQQGERKHGEQIGPLSIEGLEASELPDKGRGDVFTDAGKEGKRNLPQNTGETIGPGASHQTGLRGDPDVADAAKSGGRKHN
jgi:hypothetical protein